MKEVKFKDIPQYKESNDDGFLNLTKAIAETPSIAVLISDYDPRDFGIHFAYFEPHI